MRFRTHRPIFLSHMITSRCDCKCVFCHYWKLGKRFEMNTGQIQRMLKDAWDTGFTDYVVWGGEPLLRRDLPAILSYANKLGLDNTIITNGNALKMMIDDIGEDLYGLIISLDHPDPACHDRLRGFDGIFHRAVQGIEEAKKFDHINIFINCVIHRENMDYLKDMAQLAKRLGVKITYEMMEVVKGYNEHLALTPWEVTNTAYKLLEIKERGYPVANSSSYFKALARHAEYQCHVPKVLLTVEWDGDVRVCSTIAEELRPGSKNYKLGNVTERSFREIFASKSYFEYVQVAERCCKCDLSYPREIALTYSFNGEAIRNFFGKSV
ncbi:radical SAM protein, partial [Candidatus Bathyarchaeota archaeon]|nr:radical SAM protein [Candidatus Bathyarchaeota archaeon]